MRRHLIHFFALVVATAGSAAPLRPTSTPGKPAKDTCIECHAALDDARLKGPATLSDHDVHRGQGVTCAGCHGGDPTTDDAAIAMDPKKGFVGKLAPKNVPETCGSCHSDAAFMHRYAPNVPTDQLAQYRTSKHGLALATGDEKVATCATCHGAHGILPASDARSPVYPIRVVETCGKCHGDTALMKRYNIAGNEVADYKRSVHYAALTKKNDLSAPTCNKCHGSHGATPPGVDSVSAVCGTCHLTQRERFDVSPHKDAFAAMKQPACEACHGNHAVAPPSDALVGIGKDQLCGQCHSAGDAGAEAAAALAGALAGAKEAIEKTDARVDRAQRAGMLMDPADVKLEEANQALVLARAEIHTVKPELVAKQTGVVLATTGAADTMAAKAEEEIRFRRTGLFISLGVILIAMIALIAKVRAMEK